MKLLHFPGLIFVLFACGSPKIEIANIQAIHIDYNGSQNVNYGSHFAASVIATMIDGKQVDITGHSYLTVTSSSLDFVSDEEAVVLGHPKTFEDHSIVATLTMDDRKESFTTTDSIPLNFHGPIRVVAPGRDGEHGEDGENGGRRIIGRDGRDGERGQDGENGQSGGNYTAHVWRDSNEMRMYIVNDGNGEIWKYKSTNGTEIIVQLHGGDGGNGGDGGDGGNGKDGVITEKKNKSPGDGGNGGDGGNAGSGGDGGSLLVFIQSNDSETVSVELRNTGGMAGKPGTAGTAGSGGSGDTGQTDGQKGSDGIRGLNAGKGSPGPAITLSYSSFNPENLE